MKANGVYFEDPGEGKFIAPLRVIDSIDQEYIILDKSLCCTGFNQGIRSECEREDLNEIDPDKSIVEYITRYLQAIDRIYVPMGSYNNFTHVQLLYGFAMKTRSGEIKSDIVKLKTPLTIRRHEEIEGNTFNNRLNFNLIRRYIGSLTCKFEQYERFKNLTSQVQQIATSPATYTNYLIEVFGCFLYFGDMTKPIGLEPPHISPWL